MERDEAARVERSEGYFATAERAAVIKSHEWEILKEQQREERKDFFKQGKEEFREARREAYQHVREELRREWGDLYAEKRDGALTQEAFEERMVKSRLSSTETLLRARYDRIDGEITLKQFEAK